MATHADGDQPGLVQPAFYREVDTDASLPAQQDGTSILTLPFVLSWLVNFIQYLVFYILVTTVALYAITQFAATDAASGFASSAFIVGATIARLFAGYIVDVLGQHRIMLLALALVVVACACYLPIESLPLLIVVRIGHGFAYAFAGTATMTIAQSVIPPDRRAEGTGYFALGPTLATAIGPALGLFLANFFSYNILFWVTLGTAVVGLILGLFLRKPGSEYKDEGVTKEKPREGNSTPKRARFTLRDMAHPAVVPIGCFMLLIGLCYAGVIIYLNGYAEQRNLVTGAGLFFLAYAGAMLAMRFFLGRVQDRRGDNSVIYLGLVSFVLALGLLAIATADWQVVVAGALTGLGYGTLMPASQAIAVSAVPPEKLGTGISTLLLLTDLGVGLGPIALGFLVSTAGYGAMYTLLTAVVIAAGVFYYTVHGRHGVAKKGRATL